MRIFFTFLFLTLLIANSLFSQAFSYSTDFGTSTSGTPPDPWIIGTVSPVSVTNSGWTGGNTIFTGNPGGSYVNSTSNGNGTFTLSLVIPSGNELSVSSISFDARRTSTGPSTILIDVNGTSFTVVGSPGNGSFSSISASGTATSLTGIVTINITTSGGSGSGQNIRIDNVLIAGVLPVKFSDFSVNKNFDKTSLSFSTASETNNDYFTIERSGDARSFDAIGKIKGAGNSGKEINYEFTDEKPLAGVSYYRIKQTDFDGQYSYSEIKSVRHSGLNNVSVSPRTTEGNLNIISDLEQYNLSVYSVSGQEIKSYKNLSLDQSISIDELKSGLYFIKIYSGSNTETIKIVKM